MSINPTRHKAGCQDLHCIGITIGCWRTPWSWLSSLAHQSTKEAQQMPAGPDGTWRINVYSISKEPPRQSWIRQLAFKGMNSGGSCKIHPEITSHTLYAGRNRCYGTRRYYSKFYCGYWCKAARLWDTSWRDLTRGRDGVFVGRTVICLRLGLQTRQICTADKKSRRWRGMPCSPRFLWLHENLYTDISMIRRWQIENFPYHAPAEAEEWSAAITERRGWSWLWNAYSDMLTSILRRKAGSRSGMIFRSHADNKWFMRYEPGGRFYVTAWMNVWVDQLHGRSLSENACWAEARQKHRIDVRRPELFPVCWMAALGITNKHKEDYFMSITPERLQINIMKSLFYRHKKDKIILCKAGCINLLGVNTGTVFIRFMP